MTYCCETLEARSTCDQHTNLRECPDVLVIKGEAGYGIPIRDGGTAYLLIQYCPWCGTKIGDLPAVQ